MYQMWRDSEKNLALSHVLSHQLELEAPQVTQTAVYQAGRARSSTVGKVLLFYKQGLQTTEGSITSNTGPNDTTANDKQVEGLSGEVFEIPLHLFPPFIL
jgi:hypothetical protein